MDTQFLTRDLWCIHIEEEESAGDDKDVNDKLSASFSSDTRQDIVHAFNASNMEYCFVVMSCVFCFCHICCCWSDCGSGAVVAADVNNKDDAGDAISCLQRQYSPTSHKVSGAFEVVFILVAALPLVPFVAALAAAVVTELP